jgi:putative flippase GtrA
VRLSTSALRFAITGAAATGLHVLVAVALIETVHLHPGIANGAAYIVANLFSYFVNTHWSFGATPQLANWSRFVLVSLIAWTLTVAITTAVAEGGGSYLLGIALVVTLVPFVSFFAHRHFTYRSA